MTPTPVQISAWYTGLDPETRAEFLRQAIEARRIDKGAKKFWHSHNAANSPMLQRWTYEHWHQAAPDTSGATVAADLEL